METQVFASKSTRGFYGGVEHSNVPSDAVEISLDLKHELLEGERAGKVIAWGDDGFPFLTDPPPPTAAELAVIERQWRDVQLLATDGIIARHRDERDSDVITTLNSSQYSQLLSYRQGLRNWPQDDAFPGSPENRPLAPDWLGLLTQ